jgi:hypothetical protein
MNYYAKSPANNNNIVELWSLKRLPFEPKGWLYDMRESLRTSIGQLVVTNNSILAATYTSSIEELCDVENILLYNVGTGIFKSTCQNGFILERSFASPILPASDSASYPHYQRYEIVPSQYQPRHWPKHGVLASWDNIVLPKLSSSIKPHTFWHLLKNNPVSVFSDEIYEGYFGIELDLSIPSNHTFNPAAIIKPLLDGIISAFHSYQGNNLDEVSRRLALNLAVKSDYVSARLQDTRFAILGSRCLLHPFQNNVQWNPADDKCVVIKLLCTQHNDNSLYK